VISAPASIDILRELRESNPEVFDRPDFEIYIDGGVRRGTDVLYVTSLLSARSHTHGFGLFVLSDLADLAAHRTEKRCALAQRPSDSDDHFFTPKLPMGMMASSMLSTVRHIALLCSFPIFPQQTTP
jgi:FMN-dependent dehydrogenase